MDKPCFRVSAVDLAESEERALKVFLRFVGNTPNSVWEWSTRDDCDLLLTGSELPRPLHADDLSELLRKVEARNSEARPPDSSVAAETSVEKPAGKPLEAPDKPVDKSVDKPAGKALEQASFIAPDTPPLPAPVTQVKLQPPRPERTGRYRLVRWPKSEFLRGRARATRFLSFLASGYLTVQQLCALSGADRETCMALLDALEAAGYLDVRPVPTADGKKSPEVARVPAVEAVVASAPLAAGTRPARMTTSAPSAVPRAKAAASQSGLFNRLRRHLGLG